MPIPWFAGGPPGRAAYPALKLLGYWAPAAHQPGGRADCQPWPDVRRAVRPGWRAAEREQLAGYLRAGHRVCGALGSSSCRFDCRRNYRILGSGEMTDGEWVWPEGLPHYVERHGVTLPEQFADAAASRGWQVPPKERVPQAAAYDALLAGGTPGGGHRTDTSAWLGWAGRLPRAPMATPPDLGATSRFILVLRRPRPGESDGAMDAFDEEVWDPIGDRYGRPLPGVDDDWPVEAIPAGLRETLVSAVLDGLRRHGVADRVTVICSGPDPDDWQRDRDVTVWPPP